MSGPTSHQHPDLLAQLIIYTPQTVAAVQTFFLLMASHPEIVKRAQAEIDEVIGSQRTPALEDRGNLPYIDCIVKEVYRYATYMYTLQLYLKY